MIEFIIPGDPQSQKRHRDATQYSRRARRKIRRRYDPSSKDKERIAWEFKDQTNERDIDEPIQVEIYAFFRTPTSYSEVKKKKLESKYRPKKPDTDNIEKIYYDSLVKARIITDDNLIVRAVTEKRYSKKPVVVIRIKRIRNIG